MDDIIAFNFKNEKWSSVQIKKHKRQKVLKSELSKFRKEIQVKNKIMVVLKVTLKTTHKNEYH